MATPPKLDPELAALRDDLAALPPQVRKEREARLVSMLEGKENNQVTGEPKKKFLLWFMLLMLINFVLLACAWVKTVQHQTDAVLVYLIVYLIVNVVGVSELKRLPR